MGNTFFTADLHIFHKNILKFEPKSRPFSSLDEMHNVIIDRWNDKVTNNDTVYILGDVSFGQLDETNYILDQLDGKELILIRGNHDEKLLKNTGFEFNFHKIYDYLELKLDKTYILSHYPFLTWNKSHYGSVNLFGHLHSKFLGNSQQLNVGMDCHNLEPISLEEVNSALKLLPKYEIDFFEGS
jgi:calcineurin-like phosphoesterase family protein